MFKRRAVSFSCLFCFVFFPWILRINQPSTGKSSVLSKTKVVYEVQVNSFCRMTLKQEKIHQTDEEKKLVKPESYRIITLLCTCLCPCSPLCSSCTASDATSLNTTKPTAWSLWRCPAWWSTPCSRSCPLVTTGTYTPRLTASPPSCRTTPWTGGCWGLSTWEQDVVSSTGTTQFTGTLLPVGFIS